ncbi:malonic semialdehyde reductase [Sphingomonas sp. TX0543]|uniref:malonic semialdehyde reductase n=1 Tax=Sphingomonas sp. TX0543 TaxID=3399682 RepID=UPI003AFA642D
MFSRSVGASSSFLRHYDEAPTLLNSQPQICAIGADGEQDAAKRKLAACVSAQNEPKILSAPATVILATDNHFHNHLPSLFPHNQTAKSWFEHDAALRETSAFRNGTLQGAYLIIAARALGLDTGPMSGFDNAKVDEAFFVGSPHIRTNFILTLGYGDPSSIFERLPRPKFRTFNRIW